MRQINRPNDFDISKVKQVTQEELEELKKNAFVTSFIGREVAGIGEEQIIKNNKITTYTVKGSDGQDYGVTVCEEIE